MTCFLLDARALAKRYVPEPGSECLDHLFEDVGAGCLRCLTMGAAEAFSVIVRHRNRGTLTPDDADAAVASLYSEVIVNDDFAMLPLPDATVLAAIPLIQRHNLNTTDALALRVSIELQADMDRRQDPLILVASDERFLRAAQAEGFAAFDPESRDLAALQQLGAS